jgi:hypothetical protein
VGIDLLVRHPWAAYVVWAVLFVSDYALTGWGARLAKDVSDRIGIEGSYELNPFHAPAVDAGRRFSGRAELLLVLVAAFLALVRLLVGDRWPFELVIGAFICLHLPVIVRHLGNVHLFRLLAHPDAAEGQIRYRRWASLRLSAWGIAVWAGVFGAIGLLTWRVFFAGGVLACLVTASAQRRLAGGSR